MACQIGKLGQHVAGCVDDRCICWMPREDRQDCVRRRCWKLYDAGRRRGATVVARIGINDERTLRVISSKSSHAYNLDTIHLQF
jgi:hypothetical protein